VAHGDEVFGIHHQAAVATQAVGMRRTSQLGLAGASGASRTPPSDSPRVRRGKSTFVIPQELSKNRARGQVPLSEGSYGAQMPSRSRALSCALILSVPAIAVAVAACGSPATKSATDAASGLSVSLAGDQVTLKRSAKSTTGAGATAGQVACTDDYNKLLTAKTQPAPTQSWYAAALITWPATSKQTKATLSHELKGDPQLCIAQTSDASAQAIVYFSARAKAGVKKMQSDNARQQQAAQAPAALKAAAQAAVGALSKGSFPSAATLVQTFTTQGLYAKQAAAIADVTESGTLYILSTQTHPNKVVLALKDSKGTINTATQGTKGSPKLATRKS
jgi:hypothetical protein